MSCSYMVGKAVALAYKRRKDRKKAEMITCEKLQDCLGYLEEMSEKEGRRLAFRDDAIDLLFAIICEGFEVCKNFEEFELKFLNFEEIVESGIFEGKPKAEILRALIEVKNTLKLRLEKDDLKLKQVSVI